MLVGRAISTTIETERILRSMLKTFFDILLSTYIKISHFTEFGFS